MRPGFALRELAGVHPIGVERYSGSLGVRRPSDWTGRLDSIVGSDLISDESFVKLWGPLPDEPLTLCGTRRFVRECRASLSTGDNRGQASVKPTVQLQLEPGRAAMTVDAELSEPSGRFGHVEAKLPEGMQIIKVAADGLADWSTTADGRLHLMFDGVNRLAEPAQLVAADPCQRRSSSGSARSRHRISVPWVDWLGDRGPRRLPGDRRRSRSPEITWIGGDEADLSESSGAAGANSPRIA